MNQEVIKPMELPVEIDHALLEDISRKVSGKIEIEFGIMMPGTKSARLTFPYTVVFSMVWLDVEIFHGAYGNDADRQDESRDAAFTVIENSKYLSKLMADKNLDLNSDVKHYRLRFRDEAIDIIGPEPTFEIIKDWSTPDLDK